MVQYLNPKEIKENQELLKKACREEGDSGMIDDGRVAALLKKYVPQESRILDCGVGNGLFLSKLHDDGYKNLYGVDIDDYREFADDAGGKLKQFTTLDMCFDKFPWEDSFFDAVTAWETLEHLENAYHMIREVERVLKPGGYFFVSMPNAINLLTRLLFLKNGELQHWSEVNNHITVFTPAIFKKAFRNFTVVEQGYYKGVFDYRFFAHIPLPENKWFGETAWWVLRKK